MDEMTKSNTFQNDEVTKIINDANKKLEKLGAKVEKVKIIKVPGDCAYHNGFVLTYKTLQELFEKDLLSKGE